GGAEACHPFSVVPSNSSCHPSAFSWAVNVLIACAYDGSADASSSSATSGIAIVFVTGSPSSSRRQRRDALDLALRVDDAPREMVLHLGVGADGGEVRRAHQLRAAAAQRFDDPITHRRRRQVALPGILVRD